MASSALSTFEGSSSRVYSLIELCDSPELFISELGPQDVARVVNFLPEDSAKDGTCLKGIFVGLALEVAMAVSIYGGWRLIHLLR